MTLEQLQREVEKFKFTGGLSLWRPDLTVDTFGKEAVIVFRCHVPDRSGTSDKTAPLEIRECLPAMRMEFLTPEQLFPLLHHIVRGMVMHEVDEGIMFAGVRVRDPHKNGWT